MTTVLSQRISLSFSYPVAFTHGVFAPANRVLVEAIDRHGSDRHVRVAIVIDAGVAEAWPKLPQDIHRYFDAHGDRLNLAGIRQVPGGETAKTGTTLVAELQRWMLDLAIDRHSVVLAIGGGAVLDMAGFAAATFHRGVRLVRLPTTVLAQNDAAVGVKNGVNQAGIKNLIGSFAAPYAVIADFDFLQSLPPRERRAGLAEAVKVAAIRDRAFFAWLADTADALAAFAAPETERMIRRSAELHLDHIAGGGDPFEFGSARPLDFGHWAAHKLESLTEHQLRHGEAVAIGMALDSLYAVEIGMLADTDAQALTTLLERLGFCLWDEALAARAADGRRLLFKGLDEFREHLGGMLTIAMLTAIGDATDVHTIDMAALERALAKLEKRVPA